MICELRIVTELDCDLIFEWANDDVVRKNSFNSSSISYNDHILWLKKKLADDACRMYILIVEGVAAGQIRIDIRNNTGIISYMLDKNFRGKGLGHVMLQLLEEKLIDSNELIWLKGRVKGENVASCRCFEKCGYSKSQENQYIEYTKKIGDRSYVHTIRQTVDQ